MLKGALSTPVFKLHLVLFHYKKHLMGYFEFLHVSKIICLPLNISEKLHCQQVFEKLEEAEAPHLYLY